MNLNQMFSHWKLVHTDTLAVFGMFTDNELSYVPFPSSWTIGQLMLHIPDTEESWFRYTVEHKLAGYPENYTLENYPNIQAIQAALVETHARTEAFLASLDEKDLSRIIVRKNGEELTLGWIIWHVLEHEIHHRGELSLVSGLLGRPGLDV